MSNLILNSSSQNDDASDFAAEAFDKLLIALSGVLAMIAFIAVA